MCLAAAIPAVLEHAPKHFLPLVRIALRVGDVSSRLTAAATLALFGRDWSRRELAAVLNESSDPEQTIECRSALRECADPAPRQLVEQWEADCPHPLDTGTWWLRGESDCSRA
ncbi:MAG: hypothetical protein KY475_24195, partial [Planctomycetes bacterium]|nr:hypothetical protein [Planctomycetota bacterium]